jgi:hypothetical protein
MIYINILEPLHERKIIFFLFLISIFAETQTQFRYGIETGLNFATIKGNY